jgi:hypothetical protein
MRRDEIIREKLSRDVQISSGFGSGFSLQHGLVMGPYDMDLRSDQGSMGTIIPVFGSRHIKMMLGSS